MRAALARSRPGEETSRVTASDMRATVADFYRQQHEKLWRSLLGYTGDPELASEAEAEALTQALRRGESTADGLTPVADPAAWIWRSAFRIAGGLLADRRQRNLQMALDVLDDKAQASFDEPIIETLALLDHLAPQQRAIVALRYVADLKPAEIADVLDSTPGSVRAQLHRAHATLRQTWSDQ